MRRRPLSPPPPFQTPARRSTLVAIGFLELVDHASKCRATWFRGRNQVSKEGPRVLANQLSTTSARQGTLSVPPPPFLIPAGRALPSLRSRNRLHPVDPEISLRMFFSRKSTPPSNRQLNGYQIIKMSSQRFCGGVDFLRLIDEYIVGASPSSRPRLVVRRHHFVPEIPYRPDE